MNKIENNCSDNEKREKKVETGCSCAEPIFGEANENNECTSETINSMGIQTQNPSNKEKSDPSSELANVIIAMVAMIVAIYFEPIWSLYPFQYPTLILMVPIYIWVGADILRETAENLRKRKFFDENFLMTIATVGAFFTYNAVEAVGVMVFYTLGEMLQDKTSDRSKNAIKKLIDLQPKIAHLRKGNTKYDVDVETVPLNSIIIVNPGEKVPLDGILLKGPILFDTAPITGEAKPISYNQGDEIYAGFIALKDTVEISTTRLYENSSLSRIIRLIREAEANKSPTERFITTFARYYTPTVVLIAFAIAVIPLIFLGVGVWQTWLYRGLIFLVVSCPCALLLSVPLGYFGGIGGASRQGILIKGASHIDKITHIDTVFFDKTGTLTKGNFHVVEITPQNGFTPEEMLKYLAHAESRSSHPLSFPILEKYGKPVSEDWVEQYSEIKAQGIVSQINGREIIAGNDRILHTQNIEHCSEFCIPDGTIIHMAIDGLYAGYFFIEDELKNSAPDAINGLKKSGISMLGILSGDSLCVVEEVAAALDIGEMHGELLPEEKVKILQQAKSEDRRVMFVGDGINDAPVLAAADVGVAMGGLGSDIAIESADVVLVNDSLERIPDLFTIARKTRRLIWQNIILVMLVKILFLILAAFGLTSMWGALFADVGVSLLAIVNSSRLLYWDPSH